MSPDSPHSAANIAHLIATCPSNYNGNFIGKLSGGAFELRPFRAGYRARTPQSPMLITGPPRDNGAFTRRSFQLLRVSERVDRRVVHLLRLDGAELKNFKIRSFWTLRTVWQSKLDCVSPIILKQ